MSDSTLKLGPGDYIVYPTQVHIMRYQGVAEDGHRWWRLACGARLGEAVWDTLGWTPTLDEVREQGLAVCGNCARTKP